MIVSSAIRTVRGEVVKGYRHGQAFHTLYLARLDLKEHIGCTQGFVTDTGRFLDRESAAAHAFRCGQIPRRVKRLMSEHVWPHDLPEWGTRPPLWRWWERMEEYSR
jgi:hypothetical protein